MVPPGRKAGQVARIAAGGATVRVAREEEAAVSQRAERVLQRGGTATKGVGRLRRERSAFSGQRVVLGASRLGHPKTHGHSPPVTAWIFNEFPRWLRDFLLKKQECQGNVVHVEAGSGG